MLISDDPRSTLADVPILKGPLPVTSVSYPFSTMARAIEPIDLAGAGYLEEEYFVSGTANVYAADDNGKPLVDEAGVPYVNRLLVRRPADDSNSSGVVWVDILNASNGFDVEDHWRRAWSHWMGRGDTYVGVTSKPLNVDALKNFNPDRYGELNWDLPDAAARSTIKAVEGSWNPFQELPGSEEGLAWDIFTHVGTLLRSPAGQAITGPKGPGLVFLIGQSQSAIYLNTWIDMFHRPSSVANGAPLFDGYLATAGGALIRPLRQGIPAAGPSPFTVAEYARPELEVPHITVTSEGDVALFGAGAGLLEPGFLDGPLRRHYMVAGTPHTDLRSTVIPAAEEIRRAGRLPRTMDHGFLDSLNLFPLEPAITAAMDALVAWAGQGQEAPPSVHFDTAPDGSLARDTDGNVQGGLRYGLMVRPMASFAGSNGGEVYGTMSLFPPERVHAAFPTRHDYLAAMAEHDGALRTAGYLNDDGARQLGNIAREIWDRLA
ncbi:alpha/beta hydrolase domain-containing protein [Arthrobacter sp. GMC3]|uniref:alpha/beta hydrolase domain-containing protein n=1 Tax=Arthrobacter sp. GMC3 TaxID=2058894 RepID=UPI0015E2B3CD|nr:alpha/beta hydrolase domain-containing protein [Arthrobacter sp. GMC3]